MNVSPLSPAGFANLCRAVRGCIPGFYDGVQDVKYGFFPLEICKKSKYLYFLRMKKREHFLLSQSAVEGCFLQLNTSARPIDDIFPVKCHPKTSSCHKGAGLVKILGGREIFPNR